MSASVYDDIVDHGLRKLAGGHRRGEHQEAKAFGLVGARIDASVAIVTDMVMLGANHRWEASDVDYLDSMMALHAVASETPLARRGWLADPREVLGADERFARAGRVMFGAYHMHRVSWPSDPRRDRCTVLDTHLAAGSGLWAFIVSLVDPARPSLRAFFEGDNEREAPILRA